MEGKLRNIFYPEDNQYKTELERELTFQRSKSLVYIQLIFTSSLILYRPFLMEKEVPPVNMWTIFGMIALVLHYLTAKKYHKQYEYFYNGSVMILSPLSVHLLDESVFGSWMIYFLCPVYIFFLTGSIKHFCAQAIVQILSLVFVFKNPTLQMIERYGSKLFLDQLIGCFVLGQVLLIATMVQLDNSRKIAYERAALFEIRREEVDRQRTFLLSFSHELRNLMNSVIGSIEICLMESISERMRDILQGAKLCGKVLLQEINNILDSGKIEINELEIHKTPLSTKSFINKIWQVSGELIKRKNLQGVLAVDKKIPSKISIDEGRITQIILNLLGNAVKFTDKGNIDISIEWVDNSTVNDDIFLPIPYHEDGVFDKNFALAHLNKQFHCLMITNKLPHGFGVHKIGLSGVLKITIRDSGCGMTEEDSQKLFQKFSQVGDRKKKVLGTGLGLFISKHIANNMSGDIRVFSKKDVGTAFVIALPADIPNDQIQSMAEIEQCSALKKERVIVNSNLDFGVDGSSQHIPTFLLVDDEHFNIVVITKYVASMNGIVNDVAKNGVNALDSYKKLCFQGKAPDVITMDIHMPEMDGKEAARRIRLFEKDNNLKRSFIIMISGNCTQSEIQDCMNPNGQIRANGFLKKPVNIEEFKELVHRLFKSGDKK